MGTYLTSTGFLKKTWQEYLVIVKNRMATIWGPEFDSGDTTPAGQFAGLIARGMSDGADVGQELYASLDPLQAIGDALSRIAALRGTFRQVAAPSTVQVCCYCELADEGLVIPAGDQVRRSRGRLLFTSTADVTISRVSANEVYFTYDEEPAPGVVVTLEFSFGTFTRTVGSGGMLPTFSELAGDIIAAWPGGTATAFAVASDPSYIFEGPGLRVSSFDATFQVVSFTNVELAVIGTSGAFTCTEDGANEAAIGEVNLIETPETGWIACRNLRIAVKGRLVETDDELRVRMYLRPGNGTDEAIRRRILNEVAGVSACSVRSNRTMVTDEEGRPPKSFEVTVEGGDDQEIADVLWDAQPGGIESYGDLTSGGIQRTVTDSQGVDQIVKFGRPLVKVLHAKLTLERYFEEGTPRDATSEVRAAVLAWAEKEFVPGRNVIPQRFSVPVYSVPGFGSIVVEVAVTDTISDTPSFVTTEIPVGGRVRLILPSEKLQIEVTA